VSLPIGKLLTLQEDSFGLLYTAQIGSNNAAQDFLKMVDSGLITEHSIGYRTMKAIDKQDYSKRDLLELQMFEGSGLSGWGVNQFTPLIGMKGAGAETLQKRLDKLEKFCRNSDATDETIEYLWVEVKQLTQRIIDMLAHDTTKPPLDGTKPVVKAINWEYIATSLLT
jgi:hypothetical protein